MNNIVCLYSKFSQGILVGGCAVSSGFTLYYLLSDCYKSEKNQIIRTYEEKINNLEDELNKIKCSNSNNVK
jgi:hypothetical protein